MITLLLLVRATYMYGVVLHAHPVRGESHNQRNTIGEVATLPKHILLFATNSNHKLLLLNANRSYFATNKDRNVVLFKFTVHIYILP